MEVWTNIWFWSPVGMKTQATSGSYRGFVEVDEAERLLEEAHARGKREGYTQAVTDTGRRPE